MAKSDILGQKITSEEAIGIVKHFTGMNIDKKASDENTLWFITGKSSHHGMNQNPSWKTVIPFIWQHAFKEGGDLIVDDIKSLLRINN